MTAIQPNQSISNNTIEVVTLPNHISTYLQEVRQANTVKRDCGLARSISRCFNIIGGKRLSLCTVLLTSSVFLSACGSGAQDEGQVTVLQHEFSGVAVDGHIARAKIFIDSNNNGTRDPWEPFAFTDDEGYYGFNPNTDTDYCSEETSAEQQQYCLRSTSAFANVVLRIDGGYDRLTGEPFIGQLSRRIDARLPHETANVVISPLTTLLTSIENPEDREIVLTSLGLQTDDLDIDYLNSSGNGEVDAFLLNMAIKIHKTVTILSDRIDDNYADMHDHTGMPNDASLAVYRALAERLQSDPEPLDTMISDPARLISILDDAEESIRTIYQQRNLDMPADMGSTSTPARFSRPANVAAYIPAVVNRLLNELDVAMDRGQVLGNVRAIEALVIKTISEGDSEDNSVSHAIDFFLDANNDSLIEILRVALSDDSADINRLANNDFTGDDFNDAQGINNAARFGDDASAFSALDGKQLKISDLDLGFGPNNLKDTELELYFSAGESGLSGAITACVKYIEGASSADLGEGNFRGEIVTGFWSLLGATDNNPSSYSLLLTFDFLGANYQAIMKPAGDTSISGTDYHQIRFDYDGDIKVWHSLEGIIEREFSLPSTSSECESRLPSRVGL